MDALLAYLRAQRDELISLIKTFAACESPSDDPAALARFADLISDALVGQAVSPVRTRGPHLQFELLLPGPSRKQGQILLLGHYDTVFPCGTLASMPVRQDGDRLYGPGVFDMKAGIAMAVFAARALRELDLPVRRRVLLQLNADEEIGSPSSKALTERNARRSAAVLVLEPAAGADGKLKTARKGVGDYTVTVRGRAAHAGADFSAGASAVLELARQLPRIAAFTNLKRGITVNPGVISGGSRPNVVPAEARAEIDVRVLRLRDAAPLDRRLRALRPFDQRCTLEVTGGLNRPPLERTAAVRRLFRLAQSLAAELGFPLGETTSGGGSDGNFTAALGIPTLDGLGAIGDGMHAPSEHILLEPLPARTALLAKLLQALYY
jgi:glutamate carboxypeptidase